MPEHIGEIAAITDRKKADGGTYQQIEFMPVGNQKYGLKVSDFDGHNAAFEVGDTVRVTYTENPGTFQGKSITYRNVDGMTVAERVPATQGEPRPTPPEGYTPPPVQDDRQNSIESQVATKGAIDLINSGFLPWWGELADDEKLSAIQNMLPKLAHAVMSTIREVKG